MLVGGEFSDGYIGYRVRPAYRHIKHGWVLEKWISAFEATLMTEDEYNLRFRDPFTGLCISGPYPSRGAYHFCEELNCSPADANMEWLTGLILKAKNNDPKANGQAIRAAQKKAEEDEDKARFDRVQNLNSAFGIRAASFRGHPKITKSRPTMKTANELGLPLTKVSTMPGRKVEFNAGI